MAEQSQDELAVAEQDGLGGLGSEYSGLEAAAER